MQYSARYATPILFLIVVWCSGCGTTENVKSPTTNDTALLVPTKDILVTDGDLNKPYDILGPVEYTLEGKSIYSTMTSLSGGTDPETTREAKEMLQRVAFTKYGDKVDAIINTKISGGYSGGFWGGIGGAYGARTGVVQAGGIAISFQKTPHAPPVPSKKSKAQ